MVMGAGIGALRSATAAILIIARDRASAPLKTVGAAAAGTALQMGLLSGAVSTVSSAVAGIIPGFGAVSAALATLGTVIVTKEWLDFQHAAAATELQLVGMGASLQDAKDSVAALKDILGQTRAKELMESRTAIAQLAKVADEDLARALINVSDIISKRFGVDLGEAMTAVGLAFNDDLIGPLNQLLGTDFKNLDEARRAIERMGKASEELGYPALRDMADEFVRLHDILGPTTAAFNNFTSGIGTAILHNFNNVLELIINNLERITVMLSGAVLGFMFGGPAGALIGAGVAGLGYNLLEQQTKVVPPSLIPGGNLVTINVTMDGEILRTYIVNTITKEIRLVGEGG